MNSTVIERANKCIDDLESAIARRDSDAVGANGNADSQKRVPKLWTNGISESLVTLAEVAIAAVIGVLPTHGGRIHAGISRSPPKWWRDIVVALRDDGRERTKTDTLLNAIAILEPYICKNTPIHVIGLAFLLSDVGWKLRFDTESTGFRMADEPYSQKTVVIFDPEIDDDVRNAIQESRGEVLPFPQRCDWFLRRALDDIRDILD